jgi:hypothetical protein
LGIGFGNADFASFPAIRAVVFSVHAKTDVFLALAVAAIAVALAFVFRQVALRTMNRGLHALPSLLGRPAGFIRIQRRPQNTIGQPGAPEQATSAFVLNMRLRQIDEENAEQNSFKADPKKVPLASNPPCAPGRASPIARTGERACPGQF